MINKELQKRLLSSIILFPIAYYFILSGSFYLMFLTTICFFVSLYEWNKMVKKIKFKFFGSFFLIFSFYTFYEISNGYLWIFVLLVCISTDIGGYVFGKCIYEQSLCILGIFGREMSNLLKFFVGNT